MLWFDEEAFGKVLYTGYSAYSFSRLPHIFTGPRYVITTRGLVIRGGQKGEGDLLTWEKMKEPGTMDGFRYAGIDLSGTIKFSTPITLLGKDGNRQEFPKMRTSFYKKLMQAWNVAYMFSDNKINQEIALTIWSKTPLRNQEEYIKKVYEVKIKNLFKHQTQKQGIVTEMYRKRVLTEKNIDEMSIPAIEAKIDEYRNNSRRNEFIDEMQADTWETRNEDDYVRRRRYRRENYKPLEDLPVNRE